MNHKFSAQKLNKIQVSHGFSDEPANLFGILITKPSRQKDSDYLSRVLGHLSTLDIRKGANSLT